jgi:hypothetical protein
MSDHTPEPATHSHTSVGQALREAFANWVGFVANFIGLFGVYPLAYGLLSLTGRTDFLGASTTVWSGIIGSGVIAVVGGYSLVRLAKHFHRDNESLRTRLRISEAGRLDAERLAAERPFREMQRRAVEAMSLLYGFELHVASYRFRVYAVDGPEDGSATGSYEIHFKCNRRSLGNWWRTIRSTLVQLKPSQRPKMPHPYNVTAHKHERLSTGKTLLEEFRFVPTINAGTAPVSLSFSDDQPPGTFLTRAPNVAGRDYDWISASPREPVSMLVLTVEFDGFEPEEVKCEAVYGLAEQPLDREQVDAQEALQLSREGAALVASMKLPYPVLGVVYRIKWKLPQAGK